MCIDDVPDAGVIRHTLESVGSRDSWLSCLVGLSDLESEMGH